MRFFKHGAVLAISLPESLRQKLGVTEDDEYDFVQIQPGVLALVKKGQNPSADKVRQNVGSSAFRPAAAMPSNAPAAAPRLAMAANKPTASTPSKPGSLAATQTALDRQGFLVLSTEDEAKDFSHRYESQIKAGDIKGIRGFDKKFYLASRAYSDAYADKLLVALKEPKTAADLSAAVRQPQEGVLTLLYLLKEEGEVIEKKRGLFVRVL